MTKTADGVAYVMVIQNKYERITRFLYFKTIYYGFAHKLTLQCIRHAMKALIHFHFLFFNKEENG